MLPTGLLIYTTRPIEIVRLLETTQADIYCPDYRFVDADTVREVHSAGKRIIPYTVNEPGEWDRLLTWGVDGITTDVPDRLIAWLAEKQW
jgi:glycerophosphoryl diester phosphodiesterase